MPDDPNAKTLFLRPLPRSPTRPTRAAFLDRACARRRGPAAAGSRRCSGPTTPRPSFLEPTADSAATASPTAVRHRRSRRARRSRRRVDRPVQAAGADRRGRHGHRLDGRADRAGHAAWSPLKLIKAGMDSPAGARPVRGRAAGAGADGPPEHRQGARRRGRPPDGRPYFVMELVKGVPDHRVLRRAAGSRRGSGWSCSSRSARRSSTPTRRGSSTATSSRPTSWSRCTTTRRCRR